MYLAFYGLARPPFETEPAAEPFFAAPAHAEALRELIYGVTENRGFISISGEAGVGKTTVLRAAMQSIAQSHPAFVWIEFRDPEIGPATLFATLIDRLNLPVALTTEADLTPFRNRLLRLRESGKRLVIVFDHAERLSRELIGFVDRLAALANDQEPLFLAIFVAHANWRTLLRREEYAALDRRIAVRAEIPPLPPQVARDYVRFRLEAAGGNPDEVINAAALKVLVELSQGNPRRIHVLADQLLGDGAAKEHKPLAVADVRALIPTRDGLRAARGRPARHGLALTAGLTIAAGVVVTVGVNLGIHRYDAATATAPEAEPLVPPNPPPAAQAPAPAPATAAVQPAPSAAPPMPPPVTPATAPATTPRPTTPPAIAPTTAPAAVAPAPVPSTASQPAAPSASAIPAPGTPPSAATKTISVVAGDSLMLILRRAGLPETVAELDVVLRLNPTLGSGDLIHPGQKIILPQHRGP